MIQLSQVLNEIFYRSPSDPPKAAVAKGAISARYAMPPRTIARQHIIAHQHVTCIHSDTRCTLIAHEHALSCTVTSIPLILYEPFMF